MKTEQLKNQLVKVHNEFIDYVMLLSEHSFSYAREGKWSAGQHLQHLVLSLAALNRAMHNPKFIQPISEMPPRAAFDVDDVVALYKKAMKHNSEAPPSFIPEKVAFHDRAAISEAVKNGTAVLCVNIDKYMEEELDNFTLPHPKLGRLSIREMCYFTIFHARHHYSLAVENVVQL